MTLRQQFSMLTTVLVIVLLMGSLTLSIFNGRDTFQQQLNARAYDAATSLALAMSQVPDGDEIELSRQIDALFDRGFFSDITFTDVNGNELYRRAQQALTRQPAPDWFRNLVTFELLPAETDVTTGWTRLGTVRVISHTDFAYRDLWRMTQDQAIWFMAVLIVSLLLLQLLLRWLFKPVLQVEQQALAISNRNWVVLENIPNVLELRNMVLAMNKMVNKLYAMFTEQSATTERLRKESFQDPLTGLLNRRGFDQRLDHLLRANEEHSGLLLLLQIENFADYNLREGRAAGDDAILVTAESLITLQEFYPKSFAGRHAGADFTMYIPVANRAHADETLQHVFSQFGAGSLNQRTGLDFHIGGVFLHGHQDTVGSAMKRADEALRQAQRNPRARALLYLEDLNNTSELSGGQWLELLHEVLQQDGLELMYMPVVYATGGEFRLLQLEVYSRIWHKEAFVSAARFWPMVEQHSLSPAFDLCVVRKLLKQLEAVELEKGVRVCVNLSAASVLDAGFQDELLALLAEHSELCERLAFELPEFSILEVEKNLQTLTERLHRLRVQVGVDQVGTGTVAFSYMKRLKLDYLRIDGSLNRGLFDAQDQRFYAQSMIHIGHSLDLAVYGEGLEQGEDVDELYRDSVDGISGYFYCKPFGSIRNLLEWVKGYAE
ncbi:bifunctional diguanylate cyclase/phosphodiesterase [Oceanobacter mangrovi]|uniref:bifunctional diguanylate cyclase/phosphodiesterase n=1 Tax=Oceanobacter mangrovi TaxID=2862510 RepID=UPI001C8E8828|nr:EAL domain-containing protein [Oceanobacter mangrovi]